MRRNLFFFVNIAIQSVFALCTFSLFAFFMRPTRFDFATEIGFPYVFYVSFQMSGNNFLNFSWTIEKLIIDYVFFFAIIFITKIVLNKLFKRG